MQAQARRSGTRALTLLQPNASAVSHLDKRIENRDWLPPERVFGTRIAIHAGLALDPELRNMAPSPLGHLVFKLSQAGLLPRDDMRDLPRQVVVATAVVTGRVYYSLDELPDGQISWWKGPLAWELADVRRSPSPVACPGLQKLWYLPLDVEAELITQGLLDAPGEPPCIR
jgi:hypothetical protein